MDKYKTDVSSKAISLRSFFFLMCIPIVSCIVLGVVGKRYTKAQDQWVETLNKDILVPRGLYARIQTQAIDFPEDDDTVRHYTYLTIALTREEAERVRAEPKNLPIIRYRSLDGVTLTAV